MSVSFQCTVHRNTWGLDCTASCQVTPGVCRVGIPVSNYYRVRRRMQEFFRIGGIVGVLIAIFLTSALLFAGAVNPAISKAEIGAVQIRLHYREVPTNKTKQTHSSACMYPLPHDLDHDGRDGYSRIIATAALECRRCNHSRSSILRLFR